MTIKFKNLAEMAFELKIPGTQAATGSNSKSPVVIVPFDGILKAVNAQLGTAGVTGTQTTDLTKNGTTLVSSGTLLTFATAVTTPTYGTLVTNPTPVSLGDVLRLNTTGVHSGTAAQDITVVVVIERTRGSGVNAAMSTQSY